MHYRHLFMIVFWLLTLSSILILVVYIVRKNFQFRERQWAFTLKQDNNKALAPLRVSAYERITIMLERITPQSLVMRHNIGASSAAMLQMELIRSIREEFDHNVSLQIYVSADCWEKVKRAKEETAELIKVAFTRVKPESTPMELSREILKLESAVGNSAIREAIHAVRVEMARHF